MSLQPCSSEGCCTDMVPVWHPRDAMQFTYPVMFCITGHWEIFGFSVPPMLYGIPGMPSSSASCNGYLHTIWLATVRDKMWTICLNVTCQPCTEERHCINMVSAQTIWKQHFTKTSLQPCSSEGCCTDMVPVWHPRDAMQFTYPVMFCITSHWEIFGFSVPPMLYGIPGMPSSSASCNGYLHTVWLATVRDKIWTICFNVTCQPCTEERHCINMVTAQTIWKQHFTKTSLQPCSSEGCCTDMVPVWHARDAMQYTYPVMFCITGHWEIFGFSVPPMLLGIPGMPSSSASCNGYLHTIWLATVRHKRWTMCPTLLANHALKRGNV